MKKKIVLTVILISILVFLDIAFVNALIENALREEKVDKFEEVYDEIYNERTILNIELNNKDKFMLVNDLQRR